MQFTESSIVAQGAKPTLATTGVTLVIFLFAIDATIVSTSMPTIVARLGGLELYSWVFSIYMLTSALTTPIFGKLADLYSHRNLMLLGIAIFVVGSALCGAAQSIEGMILFRAVQGLGGGAIYALAFVIVGVLYSDDRRAKMQGVISAIWGIASIFGPFAGGVIVEHWSWRWIFFVNLPVAAMASALIVIGLKEPSTEKRKPKLDWAGTVTLCVALMVLFYALTQSARRRESWNAELLSLSAVAALLFMSFYFIERRAREPVVPLDLFDLVLFKPAVTVATLASIGVFAAISYLPLYLQGIIGLSASRTGMGLLILSLGWTAGSLVAGQGMVRFGYRMMSSAGMLLLALGYVLFLGPVTPVTTAIALLNGFLIGAGMGMANLTTLVAVQSTAPKHRIGVATSTIMLFRTFGGAFGISFVGAVLLTHMRQGLTTLEGVAGLSAAFRDKIANPQNLLEPSTRESIEPKLLAQLVSLLADSVWYAFLAAFLVMLLGAAASLFLGNSSSADTLVPPGNQR